MAAESGMETIKVVADGRFWPQAARAVQSFAARSGVPTRQWQSLTWIVPTGPHAVLARAALWEALGRVDFIAPRIAPLSDWVAMPLRAGTRAQLDLFGVLRANAWVRDSFGDQPAALWSLARAVAQLSDELSWSALDDADAFEERLQASLARHFRRRAARALQPQAQLVLKLWRAGSAADGSPARVVRELAARAEQASGPLVYLAGDFGSARELPGFGPLANWETAFLTRYARRAPVLVLQADLVSALLARPLLAAAWPELAPAPTDSPPLAIAQRADLARAAGLNQQAPLAIVGAASLEEEADAVARQVLEWLHAGLRSIALVALDRLSARRVRALLERAEVRVRDETGWKLSTTGAAAALMRWYDLVADDLYWRDLLDWLKSSFTLAERPRKAEEIEALERAIRAAGALQGRRAIRRALDEFEAGADADDLAGARAIVDAIEAQRTAAQRARPSLLAHLQALRGALAALGMQAGLARDPVGQAVLGELDALELELRDADGRASLAEFRALLATRLEEVSYVDRGVESPVVLLSLAATTLRQFDAVLLIGADAEHLPTAGAELLFMSNAVRAELGLATSELAVRAQAGQLAALLASTPRAVATFRTRIGAEPNGVSPLLERLQFVCARAIGDPLLRPVGGERLAVEPTVARAPAPVAAQLPCATLSASQAQSLVQCPYQFYARRLLGLAELDDVIEMPDKRDFGEALHEVLRRFHAQWRDADFGTIDSAQLAASVRSHARAVFEPRLGRTPGMLAFQRRFEGLIGAYLDWLRAQSAQGWRWQAGELRLTQRIDDGGASLELIGRVDRIDARAGSSDEGPLRLIDYKARSVDQLRRGLKEPGEDIQLPFYGLLLGTRVESAAYLSFDRADQGEGGVAEVPCPHPFAPLVEAVGARLQSDLRRIADGARLPAQGAATICAHCEMRGLCRRDYWESGRTGPSSEPAAEQGGA